MTVLFIAPLPPPTHGQSLASDVFYRRLRERSEVRVVNMAKPAARHLWDRMGRVPTVLTFLLRIARKSRNVDAVYLTISESLLGNIKDLCIYLVCFRSLDKTFIHLLGGAGMKRILERRGMQYRLNRFFVSRLRGVIVEGRTQAATFATLTTPDRIHVVPNFAEDHLFVGEAEIRQKFSDPARLNVLFLSNLLSGKGHQELLDAFLSLSKDMQERVRIVFVGGFESAKRRKDFLARLEGHSGLAYGGEFVGGSEKKALYGRSQVFCLPTYYPYEGQPISILEAYATGCVVVTTEHSGIPDVFRDRVNGFAVERRSSESIRKILEEMLRDGRGLVDIAVANRNVAYETYRTEIYQSSMMTIVMGATAGNRS